MLHDDFKDLRSSKLNLRRSCYDPMRSENRALALQKTREKGLQRSRRQIGCFGGKGEIYVLIFLSDINFDKTMKEIYEPFRAKIAEI